LEWYTGSYRRSVSALSSVLRGAQYEQHEVDVSSGKYPGLPYRYLGWYELCLDGAQEASGIVECISRLHQEQAAARAPGTWLYYPASEKVGRAASRGSCLLTLAFANPVPGREAEFREWYATRHIRHALNIPALVSGQCFERTLFQ